MATMSEGGEIIRILLVDDDPLVRAGLRLLLGVDGFDVVGEAADGREASQLVAKIRPDVVLMDIRMAGMDGLTATEVIRAAEGAPEVIVLTTFDADEYVVRALRAGASGFLLKDTPPPDILDAIRRVARGDAQVSPSVLRRLISRMTTATEAIHDARAALAQLSERELEVAIALGQGLSNAEIGRRLFVSVPTVKTHVSAILDKLDLSNRVQVALLIHDAELDQPA
jgi:DNA-binding NarL/FixJ family response regulator